MEHYLLIKNLHLSFISLSILLFCLRAIWSVKGSALLQQRWVTIAPHIIDSLLLLFGIWLMVIMKLKIGDHPWLMAKWAGLVFYVVLGTYAIKRGRTALSRFYCALGAVFVFGYITGAAMLKSVWSWGVYL